MFFFFSPLPFLSSSLSLLDLDDEGPEVGLVLRVDRLVEPIAQRELGRFPAAAHGDGLPSGL